MIERIAAVTDEVATHFPDAVRTLRELAVTHVEVRALSGRRVPSIHESQVQELIHAQESGIQIVGLSPGLFKDHPDSERTRWDVEVGLPETIALACRLGVSRITLFTGRRGVGSASMLPLLGAARNMSERSGVEVVLENSSLCVAGTGGELGGMARALDVRVTWDPANAWATGERSVGDGSESVTGRIAHVHVRDWSPEGWQRLGEGIIPWDDQVMWLESNGYSGLYCLENHRPDDDGATIANYLAITRALSQVAGDVEDPRGMSVG